MALTPKYPLPLARGLRVTLPPPVDREITFPPPTIRQIDECLALDPATDAPPESGRERIGRMRRQAEILLGEHAALTAQLTVVQIGDLVAAIYLTAHGVDPNDYLAVQAALRAQRENRRPAEEIAGELDDIVLELAARLLLPPSEVKEMFLRDAVSLYERLNKLNADQAKFDAALHDKTLE